MKINNLTAFKSSLKGLKTRLIADISRIDILLKEVTRLEDVNEVRCPECNCRNLRFRAHKRFLCRGCGYLSPKVKKPDKELNE